MTPTKKTRKERLDEIVSAVAFLGGGLLIGVTIWARYEARPPDPNKVCAARGMVLYSPGLFVDNVCMDAQGRKFPVYLPKPEESR
jgi:hypothetical protein